MDSHEEMGRTVGNGNEKTRQQQEKAADNNLSAAGNGTAGKKRVKCNSEQSSDKKDGEWRREMRR